MQPAAAKQAPVGCRTKAEIVSADERESGERAILNFGHTFGHAIENAQGYGTWLHGEAVAAGMVLASRLSQRVCGLPEDEADGIAGLIAACDLAPTHRRSLLSAGSN